MLTTIDNDAALRDLTAAQAAWPALDMAQTLRGITRTLPRWRNGETQPSRHIVSELQRLLDFGSRTTPSGDFRFIDLFAGVGGIRLAFESIGGECVFTSEWDDFAQRTYAENFPGGHPIDGDITQVSAEDIPAHDVLLAGFPCQPFSIAGVSKKNALGRPHGFRCDRRARFFSTLRGSSSATGRRLSCWRT